MKSIMKQGNSNKTAFSGVDHVADYRANWGWDMHMSYGPISELYMDIACDPGFP